MSKLNNKQNNKNSPAEEVTRRDFLRKAGSYSAASLTGAAMLLSPKPARATKNVTWAEHFQKNYRLMTDEEKKKRKKEQGATKKEKGKGAKKDPEKSQRDLWKRFLKVYKKHQVKFQWIKGHNEHPQNERCDKLAVKASKQKDLMIDEGFENKPKEEQQEKEVRDPKNPPF